MVGMGSPAAGTVVGIGTLLCDKGVVIPGSGNGSAVAAGGRFGRQDVALFAVARFQTAPVTLSDTPLVIFRISAE